MIKHLFFTTSLLFLAFILVPSLSYAIEFEQIDEGDSYYYVKNSNYLDNYKKTPQPIGIISKKDYKAFSQAIRSLINNIGKLTVIRKDNKTNSVKIRLSDNTPYWVSIEYLLTKKDFEYLKYVKNKFISEKCCCQPRKVATSMWGSDNWMDNDKKINIKGWIEVEKCYGDGWKVTDPYGAWGNPLTDYYSDGICVSSSSSSCD